MDGYLFDAGDKVILTTLQGRRIPGVVVSQRNDSEGKPILRAGSRDYVYRVDVAPEGQVAVGLDCNQAQLELVERFDGN
jgi:hypothetical protein